MIDEIFIEKCLRQDMILNKLKIGGDFGKVAREESMGPERVKGSDLGFVSLGVMPEKGDAAVFSKRRGEISTIIESPYRYHLS